MKVVILAGGFGTRISEESHLKPKPMVEIGGKPITGFALKELREMVALVPQNPDLFGETVMECILSGVPEWMSKERASEKMRDLINLLQLDGLEKNIGEGGVSLSRGQQQRVAFARALMREAPVLLLDEATSSLDTESRKIIESAVEREQKRGCTVIMVSHDESILLKSHKVIDLGKR